MITMKEYLEAIQYRITGGSDYGWECFGPHARYLDAELYEHYTFSCVFDSVDQAIYSIEAWDYKNNRVYRWFDEGCKAAHDEEANRRGIPSRKASDDKNYIDLEVPEDMIEKIEGILAGEEYDTRVRIPVTFSDDELLKYMKAAHERDMTFNEFVEEALTDMLREYETDPQSVLSRAKEWKESHE